MRALEATALALLAAGAVAHAAPPPRGLYGRPGLGVVDFAATEAGVVGTLAKAGACPLPPGVRLISGHLEGTVFTGEVLLCQQGARCVERTFPLLGVLSGGKLVARIRLDEGCLSPALEGDALVLEPLSAEERKRAVDAVRGGASRAETERSRRETADAAFREAALALERGDAGAARREGGRAVAYDDEQWGHHYVLGAAQLHTQEYSAAAAALSRALALATAAAAEPPVLAQVHYHLACAQARVGRREAAYASLRELLRLAPGSELAKTLEAEPDLRGLSGEPEFKELTRALTRGAAPDGPARGR